MRHTGFANVSLDAPQNGRNRRLRKSLPRALGEPLIYGQWDDRRRWALLAFDLEGSDFVLRTAFPILLGNAVESLRPSKTVAPSMAPGRGESSLEVTAVKENRAKSASPGVARLVVRLSAVVVRNSGGLVCVARRRVVALYAEGYECILEFRGLCSVWRCFRFSGCGGAVRW